MSALPALLAAGDPRHGVVRYARRLAAAVADLAPVAVLDGAACPPPGLAAGSTPLHAHFADRLWGASPEAAAAAVELVAAARPLTLTLHDLPQASDGPARHPRRAAAYARAVAAARGVVVASRHERALLEALPAPPRPTAVIPLLVAAAPAGPARPELDDQVTVLGYFYPGKGHREVVEAVAALAAAGGPRLGVTALGGPSPGHEAELAALEAEASRRGVPLTVTGYLDDAALLEGCRRARVPVAAHRHVSASGSVDAWIEAGRRPLVADGRYAREVAALRPGTVAPVALERLGAAIAAAAADPAATWWSAEARLGPGPAEVAGAHRDWWARAVAW